MAEPARYSILHATGARRTTPTLILIASFLTIFFTSTPQQAQAAITARGMETSRSGRVTFSPMRQVVSFVRSNSTVTVTLPETFTGNANAIAGAMPNYIHSARSPGGRTLILQLVSTDIAIRPFLGSKSAGLDFRKVAPGTAQKQLAKRQAQNNISINEPTNVPLSQRNGQATAAAQSGNVTTSSKGFTGSVKEEFLLALRLGRPQGQYFEDSGKDENIVTGNVQVTSAVTSAVTSLAVPEGMLVVKPPKRKPQRPVSSDPYGPPYPTDAELAAMQTIKAEMEAAATAANIDTIVIADETENQFTVDGIVRARIQHRDQESALSLPWDLLVGSAALVVDDKVTIIFNRPYKIDLTAIRQDAYVRGIRQIPDRLNTILEITIAKGFRIVGADDSVRADDDRVPLVMTMHRDNWMWVLRMREERSVPPPRFAPLAQPLIPSFDSYEISARLFLDAQMPGVLIEIPEDITGQRTLVAPVFTGSTAIQQKRQFVDVTLLPTIQGIAVRPLSDNLLVKPFPNGVELIGQRGLNVTERLYLPESEVSEHESKRARRNLKNMGKKTGFMPMAVSSVFPFPIDVSYASIFRLGQKEADNSQEPSSPETADDENAGEENDALDALATEAGGNEEVETEHNETEADEEQEDNEESENEEESKPVAVGQKRKQSFIRQRQLLYSALNRLDEKYLTQGRIQLAIFMFQEKLYPESLGILKDILRLDPLTGERWLVEGLIAANYFMMDKTQTAEAELEELLKNVRPGTRYAELAFLKWASDISDDIKQGSIDGEKPPPIDFLLAYDRFLQDYPSDFRIQLGLVTANYYTLIGERDIARTIMDILLVEDMPKQLQNNAIYSNALILLEEDPLTARDLLTRLKDDTEDRYNRARATQLLTSTDLAAERISNDEAIEALERLSFVWRGDAYEIARLRLLGKLYIDTKQYFRGLIQWRTVASFFSDTKEALFIAGEMKEVFAKLFESGEAFEMDPLDALTLYFEFQELTPVGKRGDAIIQQLVDHFIAADLLPNAIDILRHQLTYRVKDKDRFALALKLAELELENKMPEQVSSALAFLGDDAPEDVVQKARHLRARAFLQLGELRRVFQTLGHDFSDPAQDIRLDVFWQQGNWFGLINILEERLEYIRQFAAKELTEKEKNNLIRLATSYQAQQQQDKLDELHTLVYDRLPDGELKNKFTYLTTGQLPINHESLNQSLQMDDFETFLTRYAFFPGQDWQNVVEILEPHVFTYDVRDLSTEERKNIIRLALAYAMMKRQSEEGDDVFKRVTKQLSMLMREFRSVPIDKVTIDVFSTLDGRLDDKSPQSADFEQSIPISEIENFIDQYQNAPTIKALSNSIEQP